MVSTQFVFPLLPSYYLNLGSDRAAAGPPRYVIQKYKQFTKYANQWANQIKFPDRAEVVVDQFIDQHLDQNSELEKKEEEEKEDDTDSLP